MKRTKLALVLGGIAALIGSIWVPGLAEVGTSLLVAGGVAHAATSKRLRRRRK